MCVQCYIHLSLWCIWIILMWVLFHLSYWFNIILCFILVNNEHMNKFMMAYFFPLIDWLFFYLPSLKMVHFNLQNNLYVKLWAGSFFSLKCSIKAQGEIDHSVPWLAVLRKGRDGRDPLDFKSLSKPNSVTCKRTQTHEPRLRPFGLCAHPLHWC